MAKIGPIICALWIGICSNLMAASLDRIAVIDNLEVLNRCKAFEEFQKLFTSQIQADQIYVARFEKEFRAKDQKLMQEFQHLNQAEMGAEQKGKISDTLVQQQHAYERQIAEFQELLQKRKDYLDETFSAVKTQVHRAILNIIAAIAKENHYTIVLHRTQVMYVEGDHDISEAVIRELNLRIPKIDMNVKSIEGFRAGIQAKSAPEGR